MKSATRSNIMTFSQRVFNMENKRLHLEKLMITEIFSGLTCLLFVSIFLVALCGKSDDSEKKQKKKKEKEVVNEDENNFDENAKAGGDGSDKSDSSVFQDKLEEISENVTFHVIAHSNKEVKKQQQKEGSQNAPPADSKKSSPAKSESNKTGSTKSKGNSKSKSKKSKHSSSGYDSYDSDSGSSTTTTSA